ncbi:MAG: HNH endonuclease [bacterium]|nr:HNH endonuclease [bacterium]
MNKRRPTARDKEKVARRAHGYCEYCKSRAEFSPDTFSIEHIVPEARNGSHDLSNLALSCQGCNNRKFISIDAVDPTTGERVPLFHPRQDRWSDHFAWNEDCTLLIGLTPTGRATVERLDLNRTGVVNLRRVLLIVGLHPPDEREAAR